VEWLLEYSDVAVSDDPKGTVMGEHRKGSGAAGLTAIQPFNGEFGFIEVHVLVFSRTKPMSSSVMRRFWMRVGTFMANLLPHSL